MFSVYSDVKKDVFGLDPKLVKNTIHYDYHATKCKAIPRNKSISIKNSEFSIHNCITISYWFMFSKSLKKHEGGHFIQSIANSGKNFVVVYARGGADGWSGVKDTVGVVQYRIKGFGYKIKIFEKDFRNKYPAKMWHNITLTSNGRIVKVYFNGILAYSIELPRPLRKNDGFNTLKFGGFATETKISELVILDIIMTESQIKEYYLETQALRARLNALSLSRHGDQ